MALTLAVTRLVLVLDDVDLRALSRLEDLCLDSCLFQGGGIGGDLATIADHDGLEGDLVTYCCIQPVDDDNVSDGDLLLAATGLDDRVDHVRRIPLVDMDKF